MEDSARLLCAIRGIDPEDKSEKYGKLWQEMLVKEIVPYCDIELAVTASRKAYQNKVNQLHDEE